VEADRDPGAPGAPPGGETAHHFLIVADALVPSRSMRTCHRVVGQRPLTAALRGSATRGCCSSASSATRAPGSSGSSTACRSST
jgi:hypothetical protein